MDLVCYDLNGTPERPQGIPNIRPKFFQILGTHNTLSLKFGYAWPYLSFTLPFTVVVDMQQSQGSDETLFGNVFSDVELKYPSDGSFFWILSGGVSVSHKVLGMFHIYGKLNLLATWILKEEWTIFPIVENSLFPLVLRTRLSNPLKT